MQINTNLNQPASRMAASTRSVLKKLAEGITILDSEGSVIGYIGSSQPRKGRFAIVSLGGCLGIGEDLRPVPWGLLKYNRRADAYVTTLDAEHVRNAPIYTDEGNWSEAGWAARVQNHYEAVTMLS